MLKKTRQIWNVFAERLQRVRRPLRVASRVVIALLLALLIYGALTLALRPTIIRGASKDSLLGTGTLIRAEEVRQFYDIAADDVLICSIGQEKRETAALRVVAMDTDLSRLLVEGRSGELSTVPFERVTAKVTGAGIPLIGGLFDILGSPFVLVPCVAVLALSFIASGNDAGSERSRKRTKAVKERILRDFFE